MQDEVFIIIGSQALECCNASHPPCLYVQDEVFIIIGSQALECCNASHPPCLYVQFWALKIALHLLGNKSTSAPSAELISPYKSCTLDSGVEVHWYLSVKDVPKGELYLLRCP